MEEISMPHPTPPQKRRIPPHAWVIGLCFAAIVFDGYDIVVYGSVVPALLKFRDWSLTPEQVGAIGSYALLGMFVGAMVAGTLTDLIGRRKMLIGCLSWFSAAMLLVAVAPSPELLGLFRFLAGLGFGGVIPTAIALTVEWAPPQRRNLCSALALIGHPVGGILAALLAIAFLRDYGFRGLFALGGLPLITVVPLAVWLLPESPSFQASRTARAERRQAQPIATADPVGLRSLFRGRSALAPVLLAIATFCSMLLVYALNTWLPQMMRSAGYGLGSALAFLLVLNLGAIVGGVSGSSLADRIGSRRVTTTAFLVATVCISLLGLPLPTAVLYFLVGLAGAVTIGTQIMMFGYVGTYFAPGIRASALGFTSGIGRLGGVTGPLLGGYLVAAHVNIAWNFRVFAAVALVGALFAHAAPTLRDRGVQEEAPAVVAPSEA
jgi:MFS transporter, AAHS family, benzoate transport protein